MEEAYYTGYADALACAQSALDEAGVGILTSHLPMDTTLSGVLRDCNVPDRRFDAAKLRRALRYLNEDGECLVYKFTVGHTAYGRYWIIQLASTEGKHGAPSVWPSVPV